MNIYDLIENAEYVKKCDSTDGNKYIMPLDKAGFWSVYKESELRDTFLIIDKKGDINFYIKLEDIRRIEYLLHSNNNKIYAEWNNDGPEIILSIDGFEKIPGFIMELNNNMDLFIIQRFLKNRSLFVQYIMEDDKGIIKLLTREMQLDKDFIERLKYYVELDYYQEYPRIEEEAAEHEKGHYIKIEGKEDKLQEVFDIVEEVEKELTKGSITLHVEAEDFIYFIFSGDIEHIKTIIDKIGCRINIIEEGMTQLKGKPFFKYNNGLLYFFK